MMGPQTFLPGHKRFHHTNITTLSKLSLVSPRKEQFHVSKAWGGRTSDRFLTENCGIIEKLLPGDLVMANRAFIIHKPLVCKQAELAIPAFTREKINSILLMLKIQGQLQMWAFTFNKLLAFFEENTLC